MIDLRNTRDIENIAKLFSKEVKSFLFRDRTGRNRLTIQDAGGAKIYFGKYIDKMEYKIDSILSPELKFIFTLYKRNIPYITNASVNSICFIAKKYKKYKESYLADDKHDILKKIFESLYNDFIEEKGYGLANLLNIRTCPYCNRQYIFTVHSKQRGTDGVKLRPEFDHFLPKSKYPILALSFYNLIPSCSICNHVKKEREIKINPYSGGFNCKFKIEEKSKKVLDKESILLLKSKNFRISLEASDNENSNIGVFGLKELYNQHKDYVEEIMDKTQAYNTHAKEALVNSFQGFGYNPEQVSEFVWGSYLNDIEYEKRPLSKLTKDILEQLDIIKYMP